MIKNKIKIIATTLTAAVLLVAGSSLTSSFAYFSDKETGFVQNFRMPDTSYKAAAYWDEMDMSPITYKEEDEYYVKIKNTGNTEMTFEIISPSGDVSEKVTVASGEETQISIPYTGGGYYDSLTKVVDLEINIISLSDGENEYEYNYYNPTYLSLYVG